MLKFKFEEIVKEDFGVSIQDTVLSNSTANTIHTHDFVELFIVKRGGLFHHIDSQIVYMPEQSIYLVESSSQHYFIKDEKYPQAKFVNIALPNDTFNMIFQRVKDDVGENSLITNSFAILNIDQFVSLEKKLNILNGIDVNIKSSYKRGLVFNLLYELLLILFYYNKNTLNEIPPKWLSNAVYEMESLENFSVGIEKFVELSKKTQEHLTRNMQKYYGLSPSNYINMLRLNYSANLLSSNEISILDICYEIGFNNISYFNRTFKKQFGITPSQYRNRSRYIL